MNKLDDYIVVVKGAINKDLCGAIIGEYSDDEYQDAKIGYEDNPIIDKNIRDCGIINISLPDSIKGNELRQRLDNDLVTIVGKCIGKYKEKFNKVDIAKDCGYCLIKYSIGGFYESHVDDFHGMQRTISCIFILNDDFEGGELSFFNGEKTVKLEAGDAVMFPSNFMFPHEVKKVKSGKRYSIVTWLY